MSLAVAMLLLKSLQDLAAAAAELTLVAQAAVADMSVLAALHPTHALRLLVLNPDPTLGPAPVQAVGDPTRPKSVVQNGLTPNPLVATVLTPTTPRAASKAKHLAPTLPSLLCAPAQS